MKPVFGADITENKHNEEINGREFIIASAPRESTDALEKSQARALDAMRRSELPTPAGILRSLFGLAALAMLLRFVSEAMAATFDAAYRHSPLLFWAGLISAAAWGGIRLWGIVRKRRVREDRRTADIMAELKRNTRRAFDSMGVPDSAGNVDVLVFKYRTKDGSPAPCAAGRDLTAYKNIEMKMFLKDDKLCLADTEGVYAFPRQELRAIRTVNERISVPSWNKDTGISDPAYRKYKMTVNGFGCVFFRPYHILEIKHKNEFYGVYFPCYELYAFEKLTKLRAKS